MNKYEVFIIETLTNMHVGSGETEIGMVDNLIQRNPITKIPVINSSGIKGALREYFETNKLLNNKEIQVIFGSESEKMNGEFIHNPGRVIFFDANLLTIPFRSNYKIFYHCTSPYVIEEFVNTLKIFNHKSNGIYKDLIPTIKKIVNNASSHFITFDNLQNIEIEDYIGTSLITNELDDVFKKNLAELLRLQNLEDLALFKDEIFNLACEKNMPTIARNHLENGESINLFYEEILPRKSKLYFLLGLEQSNLENENNKREEYFNKFINALIDEKNIFQFGGNYSIGYGFSKIIRFNG